MILVIIIQAPTVDPKHPKHKPKSEPGRFGECRDTRSASWTDTSPNSDALGPTCSSLDYPWTHTPQTKSPILCSLNLFRHLGQYSLFLCWTGQNRPAYSSSHVGIRRWMHGGLSPDVDAVCCISSAQRSLIR